MHNFLKNFWITLWITVILGLLALIPLKSFQLSYNIYRQNLHNSPQRHVNAIEKYVDDITEGQAGNVTVFPFRAPKKYYDKNDLVVPKDKNIKTTGNSPKTVDYSKPLYIRDKNNPKILYPYKEKKIKKAWFFF